ERGDLVRGRDAVVGLAVACVDYRVPQPLHVRQQLRPAGVADDLTEDVAEQPDLAAHRLGGGGPVPIAGPLHGSVHDWSLIGQGDSPASLIPMSSHAAEPGPDPHTAEDQLPHT